MPSEQKRNISLCTWNVCLGARCKLSIIKDLLNDNKIDVLCVQESEIKSEENLDEYQIMNYSLEAEIVSAGFKIRTVMYIKSDISYRRINQLEKADSHQIVIKLLKANVVVTSLYRTYQLTVHQDHVAAFKDQISVLDRILQQENKVIILGDFNLDQNKRSDPSYHHSRLYELWKDLEITHQLVQLVNFTTWMRLDRGTLKMSLLDHIYTSDQGLVESVSELTSIVSDHSPVLAILALKSENQPREVWTRNWKDYTKHGLLSALDEVSWNISCSCVEDYYDEMEQKLMTAFNKIVPLTKRSFKSNIHESPNIEDLKRKRKNLLVNAKRRRSGNLYLRVQELSKKIRRLKIDNKKRSIRKSILEGGPNGIWKAYKLAEDKPQIPLPKTVFCEGRDFTKDSDKAQAFATFFQEKVAKITSQTRIDPAIFNGEDQNTLPDKNFFTVDNVKKVMEDLKDKSCFGFDNVPVRVLKDGASVLAQPFCKLFNLIYQQGIIPEKWRTARIIPLHKKGNRNQVENYRPIANLCSSSKIFERLILNRLLEIEKENAVDFSGPTQHGFKKGRSTVTAALELQNQIAKAMDEDFFVAVASMDLSAAFDVLDVELLFTRMKKMGIPKDILLLLRAWLSDRLAYVEVNAECSEYFEVNYGSGQGSILGPVLFNFYMAPLIKEKNIQTYADDNYQVAIHKIKTEALKELQKRVMEAEQWMSGSGLKVNINKTEMVVFHRNGTGQSEIRIGDVVVKSKQSMNVLGIQFDSRLNWEEQVDNAIMKSRRSAHALKTLRKYFTDSEMIKLVTSNVYSKLYYGSLVWLLPNLKEKLFRKLNSHSGQILKIINNYLSNTELHKKFVRATPKIFSLYQTAVNLYNIKNNIPCNYAESLSSITLSNRRNMRLSFVRNNRYKVGLNNIHNRLRSISNVVDKNWLDNTVAAYKLNCKKRIIQNSLVSL